MAKKAVTKKTANKKDEPKLDLDQRLTDTYFKSTKDLHWNYMEFRGGYKIPTGSKIFDSIIGGGFGSGLIRFTGPTETGKSAEALLLQNNFLEQIEGSKGIFVKAEGRLSEEQKDKSGIKFVLDPKEWVVGTSLIFECNVYETVFDWLRALIADRTNKTRYHIIIDSMDGLIPESALAKTTGDAPKVAAGALMTSDFLKRTNIGLAKRGHQCIMMAQVRSEIRADKYTPKDRNKLGGASGGNAAVHMPDWVIEFCRPANDDYIKPQPKKPISAKNKPYGRYANLKIWKSTNETTMLPVSYPIKFGRKNKSAIWEEREVIELLVEWDFFDIKGSWFYPDEALKVVTGEFKAQGMDALYNLVEGDAELLKNLQLFCDKNILGA